MKPLEDMSFAQRFALTVVICLAILFALALFGYLTGAWDEVQAQSLQPERLSQHEKRILELDRAAIDTAYQSQITHLFQIWMKDEAGQPKRAVTGAAQARSAYERSIDAIVVREQRLQREK